MVAKRKQSNPDQVVSDHCPNCGAPLKSLQLASVTTVVPISRSPNQWVLDTYDLDEDELYN